MRLGGYFAVGGSKKSEGNKKNTPADKDKSRNVSFCLHRRQTFRGLRVKMANGHMVQNPPCWRASYALGHARQSDFIQFNLNFLCFGCPSA